MAWWRKKKKNWPALTSKSYLESSWITNFWLFNDAVYFSDADLIKDYSTLTAVPYEDLRNFVVEGRITFGSNFFNHPHELFSNPQSAQKSGLSFVRAFKGYLFNLNIVQNQLLFSVIEAADKGGVFSETKEVYRDVVILGYLGKQLVGKNIIDKRTLLIENQNIYNVFDEDIKKICHVGDEDLYLNGKNQIIYHKRVIFESLDEITIATYSKTKLLVSEKRSKTLFLLSGKHFNNREDLWRGNYFYQLLVMHEELIIGKPLYDQQQFANYNLPPVFIY